MPKTTSGYNPQQTTASMSVTNTAPRISEKNVFIESNEFQGRDDQINQLDTHERQDDAAQAVNQQVALQNGERADGLICYAAQGQRNERNDNERVENDRAQNRAGGAVEPHDVERCNGGKGGHQHRGNDREIFRDV